MIEKILIVDDSPISRKIMRSVLPKDGSYIIFEAADGQMAVDVFKESSPHVVLMDITMPVMGGLEALEEIKKIDKNAIVIMCTADIQPKTWERAAALGAMTVVNKPVSKEKILSVLYRANKIMLDQEIDDGVR